MLVTQITVVTKGINASGNRFAETLTDNVDHDDVFDFGQFKNALIQRLNREEAQSETSNKAKGGAFLASFVTMETRGESFHETLTDSIDYDGVAQYAALKRDLSSFLNLELGQAVSVRETPAKPRE